MATYITKSDYLAHSGIDLEIELRSGNTDNPSMAVDIFMNRVENWMLAHIAQNFIDTDGYNLTPTNTTDFDTTVFKTACLYQIDYMRANGDITMTTGNGVVKLAPDALMTLQNAGMANIGRITRPWRRNNGY